MMKLSRAQAAALFLRPPQFHPHILYSLPFSTSARSLEATKPKPGSIKPKPAVTVVQKDSPIQTIPFVLSPEQAKEAVDSAAALCFGFSTLWRYLAGKMLKNWFGMEDVVESPIRQLAFKPLLVATWRVDLLMKAKGRIGGLDIDLIASAVDASLPGLDAPPLDSLTFLTDKEWPAVDYDAAKHSHQQGLDVTTMPFSKSPINLVTDLKRLPVMRETDYGIGLDAAMATPVLFALYPLYIPLYLAEYEDALPLENEAPRRRMTVAAFAASETPAFCTYNSFDENPRWRPSSSGFVISLAASVNSSSVNTTSSANLANDKLSSIRPQLDKLFEKADAGMITLLKPMSKGNEVEEMKKEVNVLKYSVHKEENQNYMKAYIDWVEVKARMDSIKRALSFTALGNKDDVPIVTRKGFKLQKSTLGALREELEEAQQNLAAIRPSWMKGASEVEEELDSTPPPPPRTAGEKKLGAKERGRPERKR